MTPWPCPPPGTVPARNLALLLLISALGCGESPALLVAPPESMRTHYLVDFENTTDSTTLFAMTGHLTVFNPGRRDADLTVTAYYEDHRARPVHPPGASRFEQRI